MVDTTFFFLCFGYRRDLLLTRSHIGGAAGSCTGNSGWEILLVGLVQCNCDMLKLGSCSCYLLSLDLVATARSVVTSTELISCYFMSYSHC
jgi:hypothetical protein